MGSACQKKFHLQFLTDKNKKKKLACFLLSDALSDTLYQTSLCVCHSILCWVGSTPQRVIHRSMWGIRAFRPPFPFSMSAFLSYFASDAGAAFKQAGCPFETASFSAAAWLIGVELSCWDRVQRTAKVRCASIRLHMPTHNHTHTHAHSRHTFSTLN